ncbi:MAG: T9SS C-terminal target domain-containing protein, partial [Sphingobacteriales bacterium]
GNTISIGNDAELGSGTSTNTNFQLTGTLKFICLGAASATDIHLSDYGGTGMTVANIYNLSVDAVFGSVVNQVQIFPAIGGQTLTILGSTNIQNTAALTDVLNPNNNTLNIKGNWTDYAATGFSEGTGQVIFNGTVAQSITGAESFYKLEINTSNGVSINNNTIVSSELKLTNGVVTTGANEVQVTNNSTSSVSGYSAASWVNGNLRRAVASSGIYDLPVGDATNYQLASVKLNSQTGMTSILAFFNTAITGTAPVYPTTSINGDGIYGILNSGFWTITPDSYSAVNYDITLNQKGYSNFLGNANQLGVIKRPNAGSLWSGTNLANSNGHHDNSTQSIVSGIATAKRTGVTAFSDFAEGFGGEPLPVTLSNFSLKVTDNKRVELNWKTESEINSDYFNVERSEDGINFNTIGKVSGHGTSDQPHNYELIDYNPICENSYYRLHQFDIDSKEHFSSILSAHISCNQISIYPSPVSDQITISNSELNSGETKIIIKSIDEKLVFENTFKFDGDKKMIDVSFLTGGLYFIQISNDKTNFTIRFIKN